jgi:glycosyltransferase involved in cell wall biosynthesis
VTYRLVLDARLLHYNRTGIGRYIRHLYGAMAALAPDRNVCIGYSRRDSERRLAPVWARGATLWTPPHHRLERWTLAAEVLRLRPRVLHSPDHVGPMPVGWRSVLTVHDLAFWRMPESHEPASREYYDGLRRSASEAARIICVSHATKTDLLAECPEAEPKVRVVHEAPDPLYAHERAADGASDLAGERPYFVFVGTISPRKNLMRIVKAFARVVERLDRGHRPELVIVGADGYDAALVHQLPGALRVEQYVRFVGPQPAQEVARLYRRALALVFPSLLEGFGLPVVEAMASGAPVITSNRSSPPEVAGDAALLVDPDDWEALAAEMTRVLNDGALRERLRLAGLSRAAKFSWERAARETLAVFDEAAA